MDKIHFVFYGLKYKISIYYLVLKPVRIDVFNFLNRRTKIIDSREVKLT